MKQSKEFIAAMAEYAVFFLVGLALLIYSLQQFSAGMDIQSPYLFPAIIGGFFVLLSFGLLYNALQIKNSEQQPAGAGTNMKKVLTVLAISAIYYFILYYRPVSPIYIRTIPFSFKISGYIFSMKSILFTIANFEIFTVAYLFAMLFFLGVRNRKVLVLISLLTPVVVSVIFRTMLYVLLP